MGSLVGTKIYLYVCVLMSVYVWIVGAWDA